ncbi:FAD-dependent oxidoreductase [Sinomonas sp. P47F7]|uniref:FAD-dependent oxidoreductase n=1 Tax=Sinomonas sp. P47F7 TaxID=3410987 RepID=UPI003BF5079C
MRASEAERHDVVIVGGGPVGLCLGVLLAQKGVDVAVLEARTERTAHSRAIGIHPPGLRVLAAAGVADALWADGVRVTGGIARSRGRDVARLAFDPPVLAVPQWRTEQALEARLAELAPGALRRGVRAVGVHAVGVPAVGVHAVGAADGAADGGSADRVAEDRVGATRSGEGSTGANRVGATGLGEGRAVVRALEAAGGDLAFAGAWVAAADGARSPLRTALGLAARERTYPDAYVMGDFADATRDGSTAVLYLEPEGIVESFPLPGGIRRWVVHTDRLVAEPTAQGLARLVGERTGATVDPATNSMLSAFCVTERRAAAVLRGRTVLLGDAAHELSPIGGQGMTLGWLDAEAFAPLLAGAARGAPDAWPELWAAVADGRRRAAAEAARRAALNMALGRPLPAWAMTVRNAAFRELYRSAGVRAWTSRRFTMQ